MEKSDHQLNIINEPTSTILDVNDDNLKTDNESSMNKISTDLCELKEINCEIATKVESSQNCLNIISNNDDNKSNDENCSNSSYESCEVKQKNNDDQCKLIKDDKNDDNDDKNDDNNDNNCESIIKSCSSKSIKDTTTNTTTTTTTPTCMKQKRKSRSTRRKLNAMISNSSMHFSDTDSEGELVIMESYAHTPSPVKLRQCHPIISVTMDDIENNFNEKSDTNKEKFKLSSTIYESSSAKSSRCNSFTENLTDVDEIYSSEEPETIEQNNQLQYGRKTSFMITEINCQGETDIEDLIIDEDDINDEQQSIIYLTPRMDLLCEFSGETITTKEGDGPFSVEIRNRMFKDINKIKDGDEEIDNHNSLDVLIIPSTDSEDMEMSDNDDDDDIQEASSSKRVLFDDFDVLSASQIVMTNVNKTNNIIGLKNNQEDSNIGDSHTDIEDID